MKYVQIIFSPTGGTEKVSRAITNGWPSVDTIDISIANTDYSSVVFQSDDVVLIGMPSFGGLAPQIALERLSEIKGNGARCILAAVYGNRVYEDTLVQMEDAAEKCGFRVIAAVAAVAEHSIMHQYAAGRPDRADCEQLAKLAEKINDKLQSGELKKPVIPGNRPYKKAGNVGLVPKAGSACTECDLCAKRCPMQAIDLKAPKTTDRKKCISCMRCVSICPQKARKVNKAMVSIAAFTIKRSALSVKNAKFIFENNFWLSDQCKKIPPGRYCREVFFRPCAFSVPFLKVARMLSLTLVVS